MNEKIQLAIGFKEKGNYFFAKNDYKQAIENYE